jgi:hypothetical protein
MNFQKRAIFIGVVTVVLALLLFLWMVVLDKAAIEISGEPTYEVVITGDKVKGDRKVMCSEDPCVVKVPSGSYDLNFTKLGHYPVQQFVTVGRRDMGNVEVEFDYIPSVEETGTIENAEDIVNAVFETEDLSERFKFDVDPEYDKQRLSHNDDDGEWMIWSYFDRDLDEPSVHPSPDLKRALVVGQGEESDVLYMIDGEKFERSTVGSFENFEDVKWSWTTPWLLVRANDEWWLVDSLTAEATQWPFEFEFNKVVWDGYGNLVFATQGNVNSLVNQDPQTTVDVLQDIFAGTLTQENGAFELGEYDVANAKYRELYEVAKSFEVAYDDIELAFDSAFGRVFFKDEERVFEVVR